MPGSDVLRTMLPEHLLLGGMVVLIVLALLRMSRALALPVAALVIVASSGAAFWLASLGVSTEPFLGQLVVNPVIYLTKGSLLLLALPVLLMSRTEFEDVEFPLLLLCSLYGLALLPSAENALVLFLGIELLSIPTYALIVLAFKRPQAAESALKYLVLSGAASATLLMGLSLVYGATGSMATSAFTMALASGDLMARTAVVLVLLALYIKAAVVPFHAWAPDTYEGASVPVTAYMATLSKAAILVVALRLFGNAVPAGPMVGIMAGLPLVSIVWGNLAAMKQHSLRRMIAYSSIAHAGYLFYAFLGAPEGRFEAITFYIITYSAANLLAFAALPAHANDVQRDAMESLEGLFHRDPMAATLIAVAMLSLAGLPPLPGFTAKFLIFKSVLAAGFTTWAVLGLVGSFLGLYFYLRVIMRMFMSADRGVVPATTGAALSRAAGILCLAATLALTILPGWVLARL
ncbi:MAG: NADH-quinone oxidoreductase subunit N [Gemmatimonadaceae bacterium]|nr:NADH-quinone oxidoreductase subunit N [Gemmatimonadaceae bacterium]